MRSQVTLTTISPETLVSVTEQYLARQREKRRVTKYDVGLRILRRYVLGKLGVTGEERKLLERYFGHVQNFAWRTRSRSMSDAERVVLPLYTSPMEEALTYRSHYGSDTFINKMRGIYQACLDFNKLLQSAEPLLAKKIRDNKALLPIGDLFGNPFNQVMSNTSILLDVFTGTHYLSGAEAGTYVLRSTLSNLQKARTVALDSCVDAAAREALEKKISSCDQLTTYFGL